MRSFFRPLPRLSPSVVAVCLATAFALPAALHAGPGDDRSATVVRGADDVALARGFEEAARAITGDPIYIIYDREDKGFVTLSGIRSVQAAGAVLIIRLERGSSLAIPARSVILITTERPL